MNLIYKHTKYKSVTMLTMALFFSLPLFCNDLPAPIIEAFSKGNASLLSAYFNTQVECVILENENIYSNKQAELILKDFFEKHKPTSFTIVHKGGKEGSRYAIGTLKTNKGEYRVTILLKSTNNTELIHQLRIEIENNE